MGNSDQLAAHHMSGTHDELEDDEEYGSDDDEVSTIYNTLKKIELGPGVNINLERIESIKIALTCLGIWKNTPGLDERICTFPSNQHVAPNTKSC